MNDVKHLLSTEPQFNKLTMLKEGFAFAGFIFAAFAMLLVLSTF